MHQLSGTAVMISYLTNLMIADSFLTTDTKLRYLGLHPLKEKLMFNKAVLGFKAYRNLAPPYLKQLFICSNTRATSRFRTLPKPRMDLLKTSFSFSGTFPGEYYPNSNKVLQFIYQLQNTAPQMVQKQFFPLFFLLLDL